MPLSGQLTIGPESNQKTIDFDTIFPELQPGQKVGVSISGGIESTTVAYMVVQHYGAENVIGFSAAMTGRRMWEATNAATICQALGIEHHPHVDSSYDSFDRAQHRKLLEFARTNYPIGPWFFGASVELRFSNAVPVTDLDIAKMAANNMHAPLLRMFKEQAIDLLRQLGGDHLLILTYSCTNSSPTPCLTCYCCKERGFGFNALGIKDPIL